ncbi:putative aminohydrolase SsnA [Candidatus Bipolaricaulota bacterium]|nr:putative aminohydrolase SsnA [Candidatus Bipolaricaulota bacterium]
MKKILTAGWMWDGERRVVENPVLLIDNEQIIATLTCKESMPDGWERAERVDRPGRWILPGMINAHTHLYSALARGMAVSPFAPRTFTEILEQLWWRLDKALTLEDVSMSGLVGAMEAARCGVTTLVDHHASPNAVEGSLDVLRDAVSGQVGLRGCYCYEVSDRDGAAIARAGIEENRSFLKSLSEGSGRESGLFGLHAAFTVSDETLESVAKVLSEDRGVHIHVAEGPEDERQSEAAYGMRIVERLDRFGLLRPNSIFAHCIHLDEHERDLIAERGTAVVHNPRSNMNNAVGLLDIPAFLDRSIPVGLGTDGLGCNMLGELMTAGLVQKHTREQSLAGDFGMLDQLLFRNNPLIAERQFGGDIRFGRIEAGGPVDLAVLDYVPPTPINAGNVFGHLLFGVAVHALRVGDLWVGGREVLRDGAFVELDEERIYMRSRETAASLWKRL